MKLPQTKPKNLCMYLVLKERPLVYGNIYWDKDNTPREEMHRIREELSKYVHFVSLFPEGDGLCFSLKQSPKLLDEEEELFLFEVFEDILKDYNTNLLVEKIKQLTNTQ